MRLKRAAIWRTSMTSLTTWFVWPAVDFGGVGESYKGCRQLSDEEVVGLLAQHWQMRSRQKTREPSGASS
jgi:predicted phosphoribosyltransferase